MKYRVCALICFIKNKGYIIIDEITFDEFLANSDKFVLIAYIQDGFDPEYADLQDAFALVWRKMEYLANWDYGTENELADNIFSREELIAEVELPNADRYVEIIDETPYLLVEQEGTGSALYRAVSE